MMTLHQYLIDWLKQFNNIVLPEERENVIKNFMSGYECDKYERCPFIHMLASLLANKRNLHLLDAMIQTEFSSKDPKRIDSDEWVHMTHLIEEWSDPEIIKNWK